MNLSDVKTDADWEEYEYRKTIKTYEVLRIESGTGDDAYRLPVSYSYDESKDSNERYDEATFE